MNNYIRRAQLIVASIWSVLLILALLNPFGSFAIHLVQAYTLHLALASLVIAVIMRLIGKKTFANIIAIVSFIILIAIPILSGGPLKRVPPPAGQNTAILVYANVSVDNNQPKDALDALFGKNPDVVLINELSEEMSELISENYVRQYPYTYLLPASHPFGYGIVSRIPISIRNNYPTLSGRDAEVLIRDTVKVSLVHTVPPIRPELYSVQKEHLSRIFQHNNGSKPDLIIGDFNAVPWYRFLSQRSKSAGYRIYTLLPWSTFPAGFFLIRIPIDMFYTHTKRSTRVMGRFRIPGSDHLGLTVAIDLENE